MKKIIVPKNKQTDYSQVPGVLLEKPLPSSNSAEQVIVASVLLDNDILRYIVAYGIAPEDFYNPLHERIFRAMRSLFEKSRQINPVSVSEEIKFLEEIQPESYGGVSRILGLTSGIPHFTETSIVEYCAIVLEKSVARNIVRINNEAANMSLSESIGMKDVLEYMENQIAAQYSRLNGRDAERVDFYSMEEIAQGLEKKWTDYHFNQFDTVKTGMSEIDEKLEGAGLQPKCVYYLAGPPGIGKSALIVNWGELAGIDSPFTTLYATLEMSKESYAQRMFSSFSSMEYSTFRPGMNSADLTKALESLDHFKKFPIKIADNMGSVQNIRRWALKHIAKAPKDKPVKLLVIDYLQLLSDENMELDELENLIAKNSKALKRLAVELNIPIVAISSMNRTMMRENRAPKLSDLRGSGQIEYDAEAVFFIHDPLLFEIQENGYERPEVSEVDFIIAKQKNGPTGVVRLKFIAKYMRFVQASDWQSNSAIPARPQTVKRDESLFEKMNEIDF